MKKLDLNKLLERAKIKEQEFNRKYSDERYIRAMQWLSFYGLLRHNSIMPRKTDLKIDDLLFAAEIEVRVYELLPALLCSLNDKLEFDLSKLPNKLADITQQLKSDQCKAPRKYAQWLNSPAIAFARKQLNPKSQARLRKEHSSKLSTQIKRLRIELGFTQLHFAKTFNISLRALRALEQGEKYVSLARVEAILAPFNKALAIVDARIIKN